MSRIGLLKVVGLALGLGWSTVALAQSGTPLSQRQLEGRVKSVDPQDRTVTLQGRDQDEGPKLTIAPNAHVIRDGLDVPLDQVKPGDEVRAQFLSDDLPRNRPWQLEARSPRGREAPWGVGSGR